MGFTSSQKNCDWSGWLREVVCSNYLCINSQKNRPNGIFIRYSFSRHSCTLFSSTSYYMASSVSGQDDPNCALWFGYPNRQDGAILPARDYPLFRKNNFPESHIINPLLTRFVRPRWLDIGLGFFCELMFVSPHKHVKKELGQYPAILTSHLVNF